MPSIYDRRPTTFAPSELASPSGPGTPGSPGIAPPPTGGHPSASSAGGSPLGFQPVIPPDQMQAWADRMAGLGVYSVAGGGYVSPADAANANSYYNKFGGHDPTATKYAEDFYKDLGALPTAPNLTPAAQQLAGQTPGYQPQLGPSINDRLGHPWQGPWGIDPNRKPEHVGFGP